MLLILIKINKTNRFFRWYWILLYQQIYPDLQEFPALGLEGRIESTVK